MYLAITEVGRPLWWSQMTRKATLDKSGAYSKFSAKSRAEFTAEHTAAIAASYICGLLEIAIFVHQISAVHAQNIRTYTLSERTARPLVAQGRR